MALNLLDVLQISGAALLTWALVKLARWLWIYLWLPARFNGQSLAKRYGQGSWAFITGASDGLGRAFARELAHCGFNLILAARTQSKLDLLQSELQELGVQVRTVALDLSDSAPHPYQALAAAAEDVDLSVLINCVGTTVHRRYADVPTVHSTPFAGSECQYHRYRDPYVAAWTPQARLLDGKTCSTS